MLKNIRAGRTPDLHPPPGAIRVIFGEDDIYRAKVSANRAMWSMDRGRELIIRSYMAEIAVEWWLKNEVGIEYTYHGPIGAGEADFDPRGAPDFVVEIGRKKVNLEVKACPEYNNYYYILIQGGFVSADYIIAVKIQSPPAPGAIADLWGYLTYNQAENLPDLPGGKHPCPRESCKAKDLRDEDWGDLGDLARTLGRSN